MPRPGRFLVLCLLLVLLPLRSVLAAGMLGCEPVPVPTTHQDAHAHHGNGHVSGGGAAVRQQGAHHLHGVAA